MSTPKVQVIGLRGLSAYEVAVEHGFKGTEAEWLESLKGEPGINTDLPFITEDDEGKILKVVGGEWIADDLPKISEDAVLYTPQTLTDEQKVQARENIGAVSAEEVDAMINGDSGNDFSETGELVELDVEAGTGLEVISKIHRDETWGLSDKLELHQVNGSNFVDLTSWLGGVGTVFSKNGVTATVNADSTLTVIGTNEGTSNMSLIDKYNFTSEQVYPAGTYTIPNGFIMNIRAAQYPKNVSISGMGVNLTKTVTVTEPFRIIHLQRNVKAGATVDETIPLGLYRGNSVPETGYEYSGILHTVTFDAPIYEGEFNWNTGELKDADDNTVGYYEVPEIKSLSGTNYFWTGFGENTVSNRKDDGKVILRLNETAPDETVPSICDFMLTPTTMEAAYGLYSEAFFPDTGQFFGHEVPVLTTKGNLSVKDVDGNVKYRKYIEPIFNARGVSDVLTHKGLEKKWSKKFYLTKTPVSTTIIPAPYSGAIDNYVFTWEFDENEFINTGIPAKIHDIPITSSCFINNDLSEQRISNPNSIVWYGGSYTAFFSYNAETDKYVLAVRGSGSSNAQALTTLYSKVYFYYQLETPYNSPFAFAMGIDAGDQISFDADLEDAQPYIDGGVFGSSLSVVNVDPTITALVPRSVEDAMDGMNNAARMLNMDDATGGDATVQGYNWIGAGDGVTDYTVQIQAKLDEFRRVSNGGTIHLGPGTYPISKSLMVYGNTQIIGDGHTIIEQRADNTHAVIWTGSNIRMCDLTIKLAGACTEVTGCIFTNSGNSSTLGEDKRDERYPENAYVQYCSISNVTFVGTYDFSRDDEGYVYLSEEDLGYRGVGLMSPKGYTNYCDVDGIFCRHLYAGVYGKGQAACNYRMYVTESRFGVYGGGGNNTFDIQGHSHYNNNGRDGKVLATDYVYYGLGCDTNAITIGFFDIQWSYGIVYFDTYSQRNHYTIMSQDSGISTGSTGVWENTFYRVRDYGRGNIEVQPQKERVVGVGSALFTLTQLPYFNTKFNPSTHNALSGAGVWGNITSNREWESPDGIGLSDICRYPKETNKPNFGLASAICKTVPSEESPVEIIIDISNRPVSNYPGFWIQFDHRYIAEAFTVSFDTTNDGVFNRHILTQTEHNDPVAYRFNYQEPNEMVYRIKISITKALQIPELKYGDAGYTEYTINYNPDGYIGIVNIGMPSNEAYGRAFLGECGGSLYGNVDMHHNALKNLPAPVDDGDAVSKAYLEERLAALEALIIST